MGKLAYHVTIDGWTKVARILREFKKKKHAGFYLEVEDLGLEVYAIKVFKS